LSERITIKNATTSDIPKIKKLLLALISTIDTSENFNMETATINLHHIIDDPNSHVLLAKVSKDIVGLINFTTRNTILHTAPSGLIDELVVAKPHQGKGIGRKLLKVAIKNCRELGCCEVEVSTERINKKARAFYKACGFKEDAVLLEYDLEKVFKNPCLHQNDYRH